jgi:hypothetical protein
MPEPHRPHTRIPASWFVRLHRGLQMTIAVAISVGLIAPDAAVASINFRASSAAGNLGATTLVIFAPTGIVTNDILIAAIDVRGGSNTTITAPAGWTLIRRDNSTTNLAQAAYYPSPVPRSQSRTHGPSRRRSAPAAAYSPTPAPIRPTRLMRPADRQTPARRR